jgi:hypothetical protein
VPSDRGQLYNGPDPVGEIPGAIKMKHSDHEVLLRGSRPGSKDCWVRVRPDHDGNYTCRFEPLPKRLVAGNKGNVLHPPQAKTDAAAPTQKPQKNDDLMNPFVTPQPKP